MRRVDKIENFTYIKLKSGINDVIRQLDATKNVMARTKLIAT